MHPTHSIDVVIRDGTDTLETRRCRTMALPDGRVGVVWRGLVYPLLDNNEIDVSKEALPPAHCMPSGVAQPDYHGFASIIGADEVYLLVAGPITVREGAAARLRAAGISVIRTGRYLGEPVDGLAADWFIRFEKPITDETVDSLLARVLDQERVRQSVQPETATEARLRLVLDEMARARQRETMLRSELANATAALGKRTTDTNVDDRLREEIAREQYLRREAEAARVAAEAALATAEAALEVVRADPHLPPQPSPRTRLPDEIAALLEAVLPNLKLLRDSLTVALVEYAGRKSLYRSLAELMAGEGRLSAAWKSVQGATGWWERHVSNGQDNTGRLYARWAADRPGWDVLISDKGDQSRAIAWLRRHAPA